MLKAKPSMSEVERACAVLLAGGVGSEIIIDLAGLTSAQLRDLIVSVATRVTRNEGRIQRDRQARKTQQRKAAALNRQPTRPGVLATIGAQP